MKKNFKKIATLTLAFTILSANATTLLPQSNFATSLSSVQTVYANTDAITVNIDGKKVDFSKYGAEPFIQNGTTYVPLRSVFESFGAVERKDKTNNVLGVLFANDPNMFIFDKNVNGYDIEFTVNIKERMEPLTFNSYYVANYRKDGATALYDFQKNDLILQNGRTYVPLRLISEVFGYKVDWNGTTKTVDIDTSNPSCEAFDLITSKLDGTFEEKYGFKTYDVVMKQEENKSKNTTSAEPTKIETPKEVKNTIEITSDDIQKANELMLEKVNTLRAENGVAPLVLDDKLINLAQMKADDMVENNYFSHTSPTYGSPKEMYNKIYGNENIGIGENITKTSIGTERNIAQIVGTSYGSWKKSNGHLENMLNSKYTKIGFGYKIVANGKTFDDMYSTMMLQF